MDYAIRVSYSYEQLTEVFNQLGKVCENVLVYEHTDQSRIHVHALLRKCRVSTDTIKNWIKKALNIAVKKTDWSFKSANDNDEYIKYMSKGVYEPSFMSGYEKSYVDEWKSKWTIRSQSEDPRSVRQNRITNHTIAAEAYAKYIEDKSSESKLFVDETINLRRLINIIKDICKEHKKGRNYDNVAKIAQSVLADLSPTYWEDKVLSRL